jgi:hypothetical protein
MGIKKSYLVGIETRESYHIAYEFIYQELIY